MKNPFEKYRLIQKGESFFVEEIFQPEIEFVEEEYSLVAKTFRGKQEVEHLVYDLRDVIRFEGKIKTGSRGNFLGLLGERMLSVALDDLIGRTIREIQEEQPTYNPRGEVLKESGKHEGKGFIATYNDEYLLRYHGKSNFVVLKKNPAEDPAQWYHQEKSGLTASEIDGLGYLHANSSTYLLIGESKMAVQWKHIGYDDFFKNLEDRIVNPFNSLFPNHELMFVFMAPHKLIFESGQYLHQKPANLAHQLMKNNIETMFIPLPITPKSLREYANQMYYTLPIIKETLRLLENMV